MYGFIMDLTFLFTALFPQIHQLKNWDSRTTGISWTKQLEFLSKYQWDSLMVVMG